MTVNAIGHLFIVSKFIFRGKRTEFHVQWLDTSIVVLNIVPMVALATVNGVRIHVFSGEMVGYDKHIFSNTKNRFFIAIDVECGW